MKKIFIILPAILLFSCTNTNESVKKYYVTESNSFYNNQINMNIMEKLKCPDIYEYLSVVYFNGHSDSNGTIIISNNGNPFTNAYCEPVRDIQNIFEGYYISYNRCILYKDIFQRGSTNILVFWDSEGLTARMGVVKVATNDFDEMYKHNGKQYIKRVNDFSGVKYYTPIISIQDVNNDGLKEIVSKYSSGGTGSHMEFYDIYRYKNENTYLLLHEIINQTGSSTLNNCYVVNETAINTIDLNNDGFYEYQFINKNIYKSNDIIIKINIYTNIYYWDNINDKYRK